MQQTVNLSVERPPVVRVHLPPPFIEESLSMSIKKITYYTFKYVVGIIVVFQLISLGNSLLNAKSDFSVVIGILLNVSILLAIGIIAGKDIAKIMHKILEDDVKVEQSTLPRPIPQPLPLNVAVAKQEFENAIDNHLNNTTNHSEVKKKKSPGRPRKNKNNKKV